MRKADESQPPRSLAFAKGRTSNDLKKFLAALMCDIIDGRVSPTKANVITKQAGRFIERRNKNGNCQ